MVKKRCLVVPLRVWVCLGVLTGGAYGQGSPDRLIVSIDNPSFRRLTMAIPIFDVDSTKGAPSSGGMDLPALARNGADELGRLLTFSGLFHVLAEAGYQEIISGQKGKSQYTGPGAVEGVNLSAWKAISVEALTVATLGMEDGGLLLEIKTVDIARGKTVLGKRYRKVSAAEYPLVIRRYADLLLTAYTGKPGIFSSKIAFIGRRSKGSEKQVYVCDADGSNLQAVTERGGTHVSPAFSRDGRYLSFTAFEKNNYNLYVLDLQTGKQRKLSGYEGLNSGGTWGPGDRVVAYTGDEEGDADIYWLAAEGGTRQPLIRGPALEVDPAFSPDGRRLAFVSGRHGNPHIFVATLEWDSAGQKPRATSDKRLTYAGWYNATPSWSPDGELIAFGGYDKEIDRWDIFLVRPDDIKLKLDRLTLKAGDNEHPSWAPNGQMLVFQSDRRGGDAKGQKQIWVMNRDGGSQRPIQTTLFEATTPVWGPPAASDAGGG